MQTNSCYPRFDTTLKLQALTIAKLENGESDVWRPIIVELFVAYQPDQYFTIQNVHNDDINVHDLINLTVRILIFFDLPETFEQFKAINDHSTKSHFGETSDAENNSQTMQTQTQPQHNSSENETTIALAYNQFKEHIENVFKFIIQKMIDNLFKKVRADLDLNRIKKKLNTALKRSRFNTLSHQTLIEWRKKLESFSLTLNDSIRTLPLCMTPDEYIDRRECCRVWSYCFIGQERLVQLSNEMTFVISKIDECVKSSQDTLKNTCRICNTCIAQISSLAKFEIGEVQLGPKSPSMIDILEHYYNSTKNLKLLVLKDYSKHFESSQKLEFDKMFYLILMIKFRRIELPRLSEICEQISIESSAHIDPVIAIRLKWRIQSLGTIGTILDRWSLLKKVRETIVVLHDDRLLHEIDFDIHELNVLQAKFASDPRPDTNGMIVKNTGFNIAASRINFIICCWPLNNYICSTTARFLSRPYFREIVGALVEYINFFLEVINYPLEQIINSKLLLCQALDDQLQEQGQNYRFGNDDDYKEEEEEEEEEESEDQNDTPTYAERIRTERIHERIRAKRIRAEEHIRTERIRTKGIRLNNFMVLFGAAVMFIQKSDSMSVDDFFEAIISGQIKIAVDDRESNVHEELSVDTPEAMIANQTIEIQPESNGNDATAVNDHKDDALKQKDDTLEQSVIDKPESDGEDTTTETQSENASDKSESDNSNSIATADHKSDAVEQIIITKSESDGEDVTTATQSENNNNNLKLIISILIISIIFSISSLFCLITGVLMAENIFTIYKLCFELKPVLLIFVPITILSITLAIFTNLYRIATIKEIKTQETNAECLNCNLNIKNDLTEVTDIIRD
jgi:hypothetical protein